MRDAFPSAATSRLGSRSETEPSCRQLTSIVSRTILEVRSIVRTRPILTFFVLTFGYSWGVFAALYGIVGVDQLASSRLWHIPFAWGPLVAAGAVIWITDGRVWSWLKTVADPRTKFRWYVIAGLVAFLFSDLYSVIAGLAGSPLTVTVPVEELVRSFLLSLLLAGAIEEFGWRGFAQFRLQERYDALAAAVMIGIPFGIWHLPWLLLGGAGYENSSVGTLLGLTVFTVIASIIFAWLFNGSRGTVPVVMLAHATIDVGTVFRPSGPVPGWLPETQLGLVLWIGLAIVLIIVYGRDYLAPTAPDRTLSMGGDSR